MVDQFILYEIRTATKSNWTTTCFQQSTENRKRFLQRGKLRGKFYGVLIEPEELLANTMREYRLTNCAPSAVAAWQDSRAMPPIVGRGTPPRIVSGDQFFGLPVR